jgi:hypothetical protein
VDEDNVTIVQHSFTLKMKAARLIRLYGVTLQKAATLVINSYLAKGRDMAQTASRPEVCKTGAEGRVPQTYIHANCLGKQANNL